MNHWPWLVLVVAYGACVGSFLNVVICRLPEGKSLLRPGSRCPCCARPIAWYDNVPILSWLWLRRRCRHCGVWISIQYPLVEAATAILFGGLFTIYFLTNLRPDFSDPMGSGGLIHTWPALIVHLTLAGALLAATVIDAKLFIIPLPIPWFATAVAVSVYPTAVYFDPGMQVVTPMVEPSQVNAALGGVAGLAVALALLRLGVLPRSFNEEGDPVTASDGPENFLSHPHPRREVGKELLFVTIPVVGAVLGGILGPVPVAGYSLCWRSLAAVAVGYLVGGGIVWFTRILGTLGFGKEAMGLGDVHLLAAIGAALGTAPAVLVFFVAPFFGLAAAVILIGLTALLKGSVRIIPYGPYLAGAAVVVMIFHHPLLDFAGPIFEGFGIL